MANLKHGIIGLCKRNKEGSYTTQQDRLRILLQVSDQLKTCNYRQLTIHAIKTKHINAIIKHWKTELENNKISIATVKNKLAALRWFVGKIDKSHLIAKDNHTLGIGKRNYTKTVSDNKAKQLDNRSQQIHDPYLQYSMKLQQAFGLRREESIKFNPNYADQGSHIKLKGTWTKGGRPRHIFIRTPEQRALLNEIKNFVGNNSLIPAHKSYIQQRNYYDNQIKKVGYSNMHGLRHGYAQQRYRELAKFEPPICGGKSYKEYTIHEKIMDNHARKIISNELGHGRIAVTTQYLGK